MDNTKDKLVRAALRLFRKHPYNDVSLTQIVKAVGVTKGSFFHHFQNKEDIFRAAVELFYKDGVSTLKVQDDISLWECCQQYTTSFWEEDQEYPSSGFGTDILFLAEAFRRMPGFAAYNHQQLSLLTAQWIKVIERAKSTGEIRGNVNPDELSRLFLSIEDQILLDAFILSVPTSLSRQHMLEQMRSLYNLVKL